MASDAECTLAFMAKRQGTDAMDASTWAHVLSLELGWMAPGAAHAFVADCLAANLLVADGNQLRLGFDASAVTIPRGFRAPQDMEVESVAASTATPSASPAATDFLGLVRHVVDNTDLSKDEVLAGVQEMQDQFGGLLHADSAAALFGHRHNVDMAPLADAALANLTATS